VEVPRLPGHGTTWREMNTTTWADWYAELSRAFDRMAADNDAVVVAGLSMGGALVLRLAADASRDGRGQAIAGVVVVNPAVATKRWDVKLLPLLKHVVGALPGIGSDIKKAGVVEDAYTHTPLKAAHSMMSAWPVLVADLGAITAPLLYFRSSVDHVVDERSEPLILERIGSTDVTVTRLENSYHVATVDNDAEQIFSESAAFVARVAGVAGLPHAH
jgi:carboxylesterase